MKKLSPTSQRRFTEHFALGRSVSLADDHPAVVEGRPLFVKEFHANRATGRVLMSGHNQRKLGRRAEKGKWSGFPIFSLTLPERATCPRACVMWTSCYGNAMPRSIRHSTNGLIPKLFAEVSELQTRHPSGFVIRLHILGDFYSTEYVEFWRLALGAFPGLRIFGYTARADGDPIGEALRTLATENWPRFAMRSSGGALRDLPRATTIDSASERGEAIVCPAQTGGTAGCFSCGFCWHSKKDVAFLRH